MTAARTGRPRSEAARRAILCAARDLLHADGYDALSIEGIAARARVGKQTVYRWWPSKAAVVAEAALDGTIPHAPLPLADTGDLHADLGTWLEQLAMSMQSRESLGLVRALASAASADEKASQVLYGRFTGPIRESIIDRLDRAAEVGDIRANADLAAAADALISVNLFLTLTRDPITIERALGLLDVILNGVLTNQRPPRPSGR